MPNIRLVGRQPCLERSRERLRLGAAPLVRLVCGALAFEEGPTGRRSRDGVAAPRASRGLEPEQRDRELAAPADALEHAGELPRASGDERPGALRVGSARPEADRQARLPRAQLLDDPVMVERVIARRRLAVHGARPHAERPRGDERERCAAQAAGRVRERAVGDRVQEHGHADFRLCCSIVSTALRTRFRPR